MRRFEMEFFPLEQCDLRKYSAMVESFYNCLCVNGLVLDDGAKYRADTPRPVLIVTAVDEDALSQENFNYDTRETLRAIVAQSYQVPEISEGEQFLGMEHCTCEKPACLVLKAVPESCGTPITCCDCGKSYPIYKLVSHPLDRDFSQLLRWRKLYRAYRSEYYADFDLPHSAEMIKNCVSPLSLHGRRLCGEYERNSGIVMLYPLFARYERLPHNCPQCGSNWVNPYTDALGYERFCRACRLVMTDEGAGEF